MNIKNKAILSARRLSKTFNNNSHSLKVFKGLSLDIYKNEVCGIIGPSGCGKTTLLNILGSLQEPSEGMVIFNGVKLKSPTREIAFVFQENSLLEWKTVKGNIKFALDSINVNKKESERRIEKYIKLVGLTKFRSYYPFQLSGGMKQRVSIARALATESELLLMDEPFGSLDPDLREKLQNQLRDIIIRLNKTAVIVSHDIEELLFLCDRILVLSERPAEIVKVIKINLGKQRYPEIRTTSNFLKLKATIWKILKGNESNFFTRKDRTDD